MIDRLGKLTDVQEFERWALVDVDRWPNLRRMLGQWEQVAISNPCFEVWLLLHLGPIRRALRDAADAESMLAERVGGYAKSDPDYAFVDSASVKGAIERARAGDRDAQSPIPANRGTRVYRVFDVLRALDALRVD